VRFRKGKKKITVYLIGKGCQVIGLLSGDFHLMKGQLERNGRNWNFGFDRTSVRTRRNKDF
jgi:hypothetical protein